MKWSIVLLFVAPIMCFTQVTQVRSFLNADLIATRNVNNGLAFAVMPVQTDSIYLYDESFSLITAFEMITSGAMVPQYPQYISDNLFDSDPGIELLIVMQDTITNYKELVIMDESGTINQVLCSDCYEWGVYQGSQFSYLDAYGTDSIGNLKRWIFKLNAIWSSLREEDKTESFNHFPNPASNKLLFDFPVTFKGSVVQVFNPEGSLVLSQTLQSNQLDVSMLPAGIYVYRVYPSSRPQVSGKFVIAK